MCRDGGLARHVVAGSRDRCSLAAAGKSNWDTIPICEAQLTWLAMDRGEWKETADHLKLALGTIDAQRLHDYVFGLPAFAGAAGFPCTMVT
jgi:hypothetical protein